MKRASIRRSTSLADVIKSSKPEKPSAIKMLEKICELCFSRLGTNNFKFKIKLFTPHN